MTLSARHTTLMSTNTMRTVALGPKELLSGLAAFGVEMRHLTTPAAALDELRSIRGNQAATPYAIVFVVESVVREWNEEEYAEALGSELPIVLTIPDLTSSADAGLEKLRALTKRAIGSDILGS